MDYDSAQRAVDSSKALLMGVSREVNSARMRVLSIFREARDLIEAGSFRDWDLKDLALRLAQEERGTFKDYVPLVKLDRLVDRAAGQLEKLGHVEPVEGEDLIAETFEEVDIVYTLLVLSVHEHELRAFRPQGLTLRSSDEYKASFERQVGATETVIIEPSAQELSEDESVASLPGLRLWVFGSDYLLDISLTREGIVWSRIFTGLPLSRRNFVQSILSAVTT